MLSSIISEKQQGFLKGRFLLKNVVDIDTEARRVSLISKDGALVLFDFEAAFPSISHDFLIEILDVLGLPPEAVQVVRALYVDNSCDLMHKGTRYKGFDITRGVRQGCPLSPLLFAAAVEILLRKLELLDPRSLIRAYADDIAMVIYSFAASGRTIMWIFWEFATFSGLSLNLPKTSLIPLWFSDLDKMELEKRTRLPASWWAVKLARSATYLGFETGPGKQDSSWTKPAIKYKKRAEHWGLMGAGLYAATLAYNVYAISTLSHIWQLEEVPQWLMDLEKSVLVKSAPGPCNWIFAEDMHYLRESFGQAASFLSLKDIAQAAKLRVSTFAITDSRLRHNSLMRCYRDTTFLDCKGEWNEWYLKPMIGNLIDNEFELAAKGITAHSISDAIAKDEPRPWTRTVQAKIKKMAQKTTYNLVHSRHPLAAEVRIRYKMERWRTHIAALPPRHARYIMGVAAAMAKLVAPKVRAACFRTWWNGWCTGRRFQQESRCLLGCGRGADSIEHYSVCEVTKTVARRKMKANDDSFGMAAWLWADNKTDRNSLMTRGLLIYATYVSTNQIRNNNHLHMLQLEVAPEELSGNVFEDIVEHNLKVGVAGHATSSQWFSRLWQPERQLAEGPRPRRRVVHHVRAAA